MFKINVNSEIGKLKKVLVHRPSREVERIYPEIFERILFDDVMYLKKAQEEHDFFCKKLEENKVEVFYIEKLCAQVLNQNPSLREKFILDFLNQTQITSKAVYSACQEFFLNFKNNLELINATIEGVKKSEIKVSFSSSLSDQMLEDDVNYPFYIDPIPNLLFQRDPICSIFNSINIHNMWSKTRKREKIYYELVFKNHPNFKSIDFLLLPEDEGTIEGGDIEVINKKIIFVAISERTNAKAIENFAKKIFKKYKKLEKIISPIIPKSHGTMHLDTLLTQVDYEKFLVSPYITKRKLEFFVIKKQETNLVFEKHFEYLEKIIKNFISKEAVFIEIGGKEKVSFEREQWNDGSNALCIEPGKIVVYDRNFVSNEDILKNGITTIQIKSSELSRGRGGPRCMVMPLERERI